MNRQIKPGDTVERPKGLVVHRGVVTRRFTILHNTPERGEHESGLAEFADGKLVTIRHCPENERQARMIRADAILAAPKAYNLFFNNCEHTVSAVTDGQRKSGQMGLAAACAVVIAVLLS